MWQWRDRQATQIPRKARIAGWRLVAVGAIAAAEGGSIGYALHRGESFKSEYGGMLFGAIDFTIGAFVLSAIYLRVAQPTRALAPGTES
jgi:hypothetical protein